MNSQEDGHFMRLALREARRGLGRTSPNPCVGAVIVKDEKIIAKGYHKKAGTPHAEINALRQATDVVAGATLYVTLEPCNHTGKTPPCTRAIAESGIARVVIGMKDPNPDRDGCPAMRTTRDWVTQYGGTVDLLIEDPNGDHGAFHQNPDNVNAALDVFAKLLSQ